MLGIERIGNNETVVSVGEVEILFSYNTPVVVHRFSDPYETLVTEKYFSVTTSRHINKYVKRFSPETVRKVAQDEIESFADDIS